MKRSCAAIGMCLALGLMAVSGQSNNPAVAFDSLSKDFGTVTQGEILKHVFTFINKGSGVLTISDVAPT